MQTLTSNPFTERPASDEYAAYYEKYITLVPDGDIVQTLKDQVDATVALLRSIPSEKGDYRYAPDKWTIKQTILHAMDTERILAYRALRISRGDKTPLPGFDQDPYARRAPAGRYTLTGLADEWVRLRLANLDLFRGMTEDMVLERGEASGFVISARALAWIIAGHERHHVNLIRDRYLS